MKKVLVCAATTTEMQACVNGIRSLRFKVIKTGMGLERARRVLSHYLSNAPKDSIDLVVSAGFAGSLGSSLPLHTWIVAKWLGYYNPERASTDLRELLAPKMSLPMPAIEVALISSDKIVRHDSDVGRAILGALSQHPHLAKLPVAVDMESFALAEAAAEFQIPFLALRLISDTPDRPLPSWMGDWISLFAKPNLKDGVQALTRTLKDPQGVGHLIRQGSQSAIALKQGWSKISVEALVNS